MSLKLNERYPGRYNNPSADYPQGSFKNRTTPTAKDGSYLEQDWANDKEGFFQSLIAAAGALPNGLVDKVGASQFFDCLLHLAQNQTAQAFPTAGTSTALTLTPAPAIDAYAAYQRFSVKFSVTSGVNPTINVSGKGAKNLKQYNSSGAKIAASFVADQISDVIYDGAEFVLLSPLNALPQASESTPGIIEIATQPETAAGTDDQRAVTPLKLGQTLPYRGVAMFHTPGTFTWTVPAGVKKCWVEVTGGGGSGGFYALASGPSGGAGGGVAKKLVDLTGVTSVSVVVGVGGVSQTVLGTTGSPGGTSSFGAFCQATGGAGGLISGNASVPGAGTGGDINYNLGAGSPAVLIPPVGSPNMAGGYGGGAESICAVSGGTTPTQPGMGGGGRTSGSGSTPGAPGAVRIWY